MNNILETYDHTQLSYAFSDVNGETYLTLGDGLVEYHLQMPDYESKNNVNRVSLSTELRTYDTALAVFKRAVLGDHMSRDGRKSLQSSFPQISAKVHLTKPLQGQIRRTAAIWATRKTPALDKAA